MKAENTIPLDVDLMTGNKEGDNKMEITEKELCEYCSEIPNSKCIACKYRKTCACFMIETEGIIPSFYVLDGVYTGENPNRIWEIIDNIEEKEKNNMLPKNVKITNKIEENTVYVNDCSKYPIKSDEEYVCIFNGDVFGSNSVVANIEITGNIINMSKNIIAIYNKEVKKVYMVEVGSIKCLLPKTLHETITSLNDNK